MTFKEKITWIRGLMKKFQEDEATNLQVLGTKEPAPNETMLALVLAKGLKTKTFRVSQALGCLMNGETDKICYGTTDPETGDKISVSITWTNKDEYDKYIEEVRKR